MVAVMSAQEIIKQIKSLPINYLIKRIGQTLMGMTGPKPENGAEGLKNYDPEAYAVMDDFYSGRIVIGKVEPCRGRSNTATGAAFSPKANPFQH